MIKCDKAIIHGGYIDGASRKMIYEIRVDPDAAKWLHEHEMDHSFVIPYGEVIQNSPAEIHFKDPNDEIAFKLRWV